MGEPTRRKRRRPRLNDDAAAHVLERIISGQRSAGEFIRPGCPRHYPADVQALETLQTRLDAAAERGYYDRVEQLNFEFHRTIYRLARVHKISGLLGAALRYVPREFFAAVPGWPEASAHDHHAVLTALRNRESARAAMRTRVTAAGALLAEHLTRPNARGTGR